MRQNSVSITLRDLFCIFGYHFFSRDFLSVVVIHACVKSKYFVARPIMTTVIVIYLSAGVLVLGGGGGREII